MFSEMVRRQRRHIRCGPAERKMVPIWRVAGYANTIIDQEKNPFCFGDLCKWKVIPFDFSNLASIFLLADASLSQTILFQPPKLLSPSFTTKWSFKVFSRFTGVDLPNSHAMNRTAFGRSLMAWSDSLLFTLRVHLGGVGNLEVQSVLALPFGGNLREFTPYSSPESKGKV